MPDNVILTFHEKYEQYDLGEGHPFRGDRFSNALKFFDTQGLLRLSNVKVATPQSASREDLLRVHDEKYVDRIYRLAQERRPYDAETPVSPEILEALLLITGAGMQCGRAIFESEVKCGISIGGGYHHAGRNYGGGFCVFNDVAVVVEYLRAMHGVKRVLNLDYDVHYGNGTSDIYYRDPSVLYISLHQDPHTIYPGTGFVWQIGEGEGEGYNVCAPLPPGTGDSTYLHALDEIFVPLAEEFKPDVIIGNGGSDAHFADMLGSLSLSVRGFYEVARIIKQTADSVCKGRVILMLGSGYNPNILPQCWYALVAGIVGSKKINIEESPPAEPPECRRTVEKTLDELKRLLRKHWSCFGGFSLNAVP